MYNVRNQANVAYTGTGKEVGGGGGICGRECLII